MSKRKICVVVTARPSYSRIRTALEAVRDHSDLELQLVVAASALLHRYGTVIEQMRKDGFDVTREVYMILEGENPVTMAKTTGIGLVELATVFDNLAPDFVVTIADRYETLATAVAASYMNIPLVHVQGGEITGSIDEKVRHAVTKLSDYHFVSSDRAANRVQRMGEAPQTVFVTGCPSIDIAADVARSPKLDFDPIAKYGGVGRELDMDHGYVVVMQHPVTNEHAQARHDVTQTLHAVRDVGVPALWFWPNPDAGSDGTSAGIRAFRERNPGVTIHFFRNMEPADFLRLICNSRALIGNSSVGIREASYLGVPVVNIGSRQDGRDRGRNVIDVTYEEGEILAAIRRQIAHGPYESDALYGNGDAGTRIAQLLTELEPACAKRLNYE